MSKFTNEQQAYLERVVEFERFAPRDEPVIVLIRAGITGGVRGDVGLVDGNVESVLGDVGEVAGNVGMVRGAVINDVEGGVQGKIEGRQCYAYDW